MRFNDPRRRAAQAARQALGQDQPRTTQDFINQLLATQGQEPWRLRQVPDGGVFGAINPYQPTGNISLDNRPAPAAAPTQPARQAPPPRRPGTIHNSVEQASQEYRDWRDSLPGIEGARVRLADWAYGKEQSGLQDFAGEVLAAPFRMAGRYHAGDFKGAGIDLGAEALGAMAGAFIPGGGAVVRAGSRAAKGAAKEAAEGAARGALRGAEEELANIARLQREIAQINREIGQRNPMVPYEQQIERIMAGRPMSELSPRELQQVIDLDNRNLGALDAIERGSPWQPNHGIPQPNERFAILTPENPGGSAVDEATNAARRQAFEAELRRRGYDFEPVQGRYQDGETGEVLTENSYLIRNMPEREAKLLGARYGQNGVITQAGYHSLGSGALNPSRGLTAASDIPYTELPSGARFALDIDWENTTRSPVNTLPVPRNANPEVMRIAEEYIGRSGVQGNRLPPVRKVDPERAALMARTYERLESMPDSPEVRQAYEQLGREIDAQFQAIEDAGYKIEFVDDDPYKNSAEMMADLRDNRRLRVFRTGEGQGHPLLTNEQNDKFRAVHDFFGHSQSGYQFGPRGEEGAFRDHSYMFGPLARRAMATETRGQNSWVNFGPNAHLPPRERPFAQQKAALWPEEFMGDYPDMPVPSGPPVTVREPRRVSTREGSGWTDGYTTVEYDVGPDGPVRVMYKNPSEDGVLRIENIDTPALDEFTGRIGPGAIRRILRDLQESTGARRITAERVSGANPNRELSIDLPKTPNGGAFAEPNVSVGSEVTQGGATLRATQVGRPLRIGPEQAAYDVSVGGKSFPLQVELRPGAAAGGGDELFVHWVGGEAGSVKPGDIGPAGMRQVIRALQQNYPTVRQISGFHVTNRAQRMNVNPLAELNEAGELVATQRQRRTAPTPVPSGPQVTVRDPAVPASGGDNLGFPGGNPRRTGLVREQDVIPGTPVAGTPADAPLQHDLARHVGPRIPGQRVQDAEDMAFDAMTGPIWRDLTERGLELTPDPWYHTPRTRQRALDALGDEGYDAYLRMMQMMAAVTARSQPPNNLRRAQYYYGLDRAGLLFPDLLDAGAYKRVPTGYGHLAQGAHHAGIRRLLTEGGINSVANPKPAGFGENLLGNMRPYTMDSRIGQALLAIEPRLEDVGALRRTVQEGIDTASPTNWGYAPLERAGQRAAELFQQQGLLDAPSGIAPTARAQELPWIALSEVLPDAPPNLGTFDEIFDMFADEAARRWGVDPITANRLIWEGHPALLPLNSRSNPVPRDIWRELGIIR